MKIGDEKGERPGSLDLIAFFSFSAILPTRPDLASFRFLFSDLFYTLSCPANAGSILLAVPKLK
jgi:hypothetical protein